MLYQGSFLFMNIGSTPAMFCVLFRIRQVGREELILAPCPQEDAETLVVEELGLSEQTRFWMVT